eukprot:gene2650-5551_t
MSKETIEITSMEATLSAIDQLSSHDRIALFQRLALHCKNDGLDEMEALVTSVHLCRLSADTWMKAPLEVLKEVFINLDYNSAVAASYVCRRWHDAFSEDIWHYVYQNSMPCWQATYSLEPEFASWDELCKVVVSLPNSPPLRKSLTPVGRFITLNSIYIQETRQMLVSGITSQKTIIENCVEYSLSPFSVTPIQHDQTPLNTPVPSSIACLPHRMLLIGTFRGTVHLIQQDGSMFTLNYNFYSKINYILVFPSYLRHEKKDSNSINVMLLTAVEASCFLLENIQNKPTLSGPLYAILLPQLQQTFQAYLFASNVQDQGGTMPIHLFLCDQTSAATISLDDPVRIRDSNSSTESNQIREPIIFTTDDTGLLADDRHVKCFAELNTELNTITWYRMCDHIPIHSILFQFGAQFPLPLHAIGICAGLVFCNNQRFTIIQREAGEIISDQYDVHNGLTRSVTFLTSRCLAVTTDHDTLLTERAFKCEHNSKCEGKVNFRSDDHGGSAYSFKGNLCRVVIMEDREWEVNDVCAWLHTIKLENLCPLFEQQEIDGDVLMHLTDESLEEMGVTSSLSRAKILAKRKLLGDPKSSQFYSPRSASCTRNTSKDEGRATQQTSKECTERKAYISRSNSGSSKHSRTQSLRQSYTQSRQKSKNSISFDASRRQSLDQKRASIRKQSKYKSGFEGFQNAQIAVLPSTRQQRQKSHDTYMTLEAVSSEAQQEVEGSRGNNQPAAVDAAMATATATNLDAYMQARHELLLMFPNVTPQAAEDALRICKGSLSDATDHLLALGTSREEDNSVDSFDRGITDPWFPLIVSEISVTKDHDQEWLHGQISREEANDLLHLHGLGNGLFLIRKSVTVEGAYVLSLAYDGRTFHHIIYADPPNRYEFFNFVCPSLTDLVGLLSDRQENDGWFTPLTQHVPKSAENRRNSGYATCDEMYSMGTRRDEHFRSRTVTHTTPNSQVPLSTDKPPLLSSETHRMQSFENANLQMNASNTGPPLPPRMHALSLHPEDFDLKISKPSKPYGGDRCFAVTVDGDDNPLHLTERGFPRNIVICTFPTCIQLKASKKGLVHAEIDYASIQSVDFSELLFRLIVSHGRFMGTYMFRTKKARSIYQTIEANRDYFFQEEDKNLAKLLQSGEFQQFLKRNPDFDLAERSIPERRKRLFQLATNFKQKMAQSMRRKHHQRMSEPEEYHRNRTNSGTTTANSASTSSLATASRPQTADQQHSPASSMPASRPPAPLPSSPATNISTTPRRVHEHSSFSNPLQSRFLAWDEEANMDSARTNPKAISESSIPTHSSLVSSSTENDDDFENENIYHEQLNFVNNSQPNGNEKIVLPSYSDDNFQAAVSLQGVSIEDVEIVCEEEDEYQSVDFPTTYDDLISPDERLMNTGSHPS